MDQEKAEEEPDHVVCLCFSVKTGLLLWTSFVTVVSLCPVIFFLTTGIINFSEKKNIPIFCFLLLDRIASLFGIAAVFLKRRILLLICFWLTLFAITYTIVFLIISVLMIAGGGHVHFASKMTKYLLVTLFTVWFLVYILCQVIYAQLLKINVKELPGKAKEEEGDEAV